MKIFKKIKKYYFITYYSFKQSMTYKFNNLLGVISSIIFLVIIYYMWRAIYISSEQFNLNELQKTLTYVIIITIVSQIVSRNFETDLGNSIVSGKIAIDLIRPINFFGYCFFRKLGIIILNIIISVIPLLLISIFWFKIDLISNFKLFTYFLISISLSVILVFIFEFLIGLSSFITHQIFGISLLKNAIINVSAGLIIPLKYYPEVFKNICSNLPFHAMFTAPTSIYLDSITTTNMLHKLLILIGFESSHLILIMEQIIWIIILSIILIFTWKIAKKKIIIQGG